MVSVIHKGACKAAVGKQRVQLDMKPAKFVTLRTAGDVQRLQRGLLPYRRKRRLIAGAKVAEFYRPMLYLSCHPLQFLRQLFRGACILVQKRGDPAAGFVGFKGDFLYPLYMIFFLKH